LSYFDLPSWQFYKTNKLYFTCSTLKVEVGLEYLI
jgi:hypothetical protein